ncbi:MAG: transposase [bacterium]|nr:transposase [bacterium]
MGHSSLIMGPERRRRWSETTKRAVLEAAFAPGAVVIEVARQHEISTSLIYKWRQEAMAAVTAPAFAPAILLNEPAPAPATSRPEPAIVVELVGGARVSITADASPGLVAATLRALR